MNAMHFFPKMGFLMLTVALGSSLSVQGGETLSAKAKVISPVVEPEAWGGPILGGGVKSNGDFTEGSLFYVQPLLNTIDGGSMVGGSVLFVEPYLTWGSGDEFGASLGLGFRHLFNAQTHEEAASSKIAGFLTEGFFVGGNTFVDFAHSARGSDFWQIGLGLEAGTRYLEFRFNYYIPLSDEEVLDRTVSTATSTQTTSRTGGGVRRTTTTRTTTRTVTELFEEAMEGWDIEAAVLLPYVDQFMDVKLIGGYYDFQGDRSRASDFAGWRAGVEARLLPAVVLFGHWYDRDGFYEDNWIAGVRFEIPLGANRRDGFTMRRRHLAERMFEPVRRQNSSITTTGVVSDTVSADTETSTTTSTQRIAPPPPAPSGGSNGPPSGEQPS